jgi:hypothetical protein
MITLQRCSSSFSLEDLHVSGFRLKHILRSFQIFGLEEKKRKKILKKKSKIIIQDYKKIKREKDF